VNPPFLLRREHGIALSLHCLDMLEKQLEPVKFSLDLSLQI
jgi:hypothetical protein